MSRYGTPFCSDEELMGELNKLGYDDVSPDVFSMMKGDLAELIEKDQDNLPLSEYDNDVSPLSSKFLSASSDALIECRTEKQTSNKTNSKVSRKVKKKSQNKSRAMKDRDSEKFGSESSRCQNTVNEPKIKSSSSVSLDYEDVYETNVYEPKLKSSSSVSLDYENMYDIPGEDTLAEIEGSRNKFSEPKSNDNYSLRNSKAEINRNENIKGKNTSKGRKSKESNFQLDYSTKNDTLSKNSDISVSKYRSNALKNSKCSSSLEESFDQVYNLPDTRKDVTDYSLNTVKDAFKTFKLDKNSSEPDEFLFNNYKGSDINFNTSYSSTSSETKTMNRKVLRRRNGRSVITEELIEIPNVFDTSYPDSENLNSSKSFSSDDLSYKSNGSTGSVTAISPESIKSSPSTFSLISTRSTSLRVPNSRKKKSDPVAMYGYYRKFWENFKPPGENTHDRLRWAVRDKMLEYNI